MLDWCYCGIPHPSSNLLQLAGPYISTCDLNMNEHKFQRFYSLIDVSSLSICTNMCFTPLPLWVFKEGYQTEDTSMVAAAKTYEVWILIRIILKKITLSGYVHDLLLQVAMTYY
jgi:hypothetical protein